MPDEAKRNNGNGLRISIEWFRLITPTLVTVSLFMLGGLSFQLHRVDDKLFAHLTNDDIHVPREQVVSQGEFDLHCKYADDNHRQYLAALKETEEDLKDYIDVTFSGKKR